MAKNGKNKKRCEKYKQQGRRERNKAIRQEKAKAREEKFRQRREAGKAYEYKPIPYDPQSADKKERKAYFAEQIKRAAKNVDRRLPLQRLTSIFAKLDREIAKQKAVDKLRSEKRSSKKQNDEEEY